MGRNAKGGRPQLLDRLHDIDLLVTDADGTRRVRVRTVVSAGEAIFRLARTASGPMRFARAPRSIYDSMHVPDPHPEAS